MRCLALLGSLVCFVSLTLVGCGAPDNGEPTPKAEPAPPSQPVVSEPSKPAPPKAVDDAGVVARLKAAEVSLRESGGNVVEANFEARIFPRDYDLALLDDLDKLPKLASVKLSGPDIKDDVLTHLSDIKSLRALTLGDTAITDAGLKTVAKMPNLEEIGLRRTAVTAEGMKHLATMPKLKRIFAPLTNLDNDALAVIGKITTLEALDLQEVNRYTDEGVKSLSGLKNMKMIKLYGKNNVSDASLDAIKGWKNLKVLGLDRTGITDDGVAAVLPNFPLLEEVYLHETVASTATITALSKLPKLRKTRLRGTPLKNDDLQILAKSKTLQEVDLSEIFGLGDAGLEYLTAAPKLQNINLWGTGVTDEGMVSIGKITGLTSLNIDDTYIHDDGLAHLAPLTKLTFLHLGKTKVTDEGLPSLYGMQDMKTLILTNVNGVSEDGITALKAKLPNADIQYP